MDDLPPTDEPNSFASAILGFDSITGPILDAVEGYKAQCIARGWNETAAEMAALHYHAFLYQALITPPQARP